MRTYSKLLAISIFLCVTTACTTMVPRKDLPYPLTNDEYGGEVKTVTIPLPVIASSPNEGITAGALTAFLLHDKNDEVDTLIAPQVNYNKNFGTTFSLYGAFYPSPDRSWEMNLSQSTIINNDYELKVRDKTFLDKKLELNGFAYSFSDGSARFFGFNTRSPKDNETNYTDKEFGFNISVGYDIGKHFQVVLGERLRKVSIHNGAVSNVDFIGDNFASADVPGLDGFTAHAQRISLIYSTLDSLTLPTYGGYAKGTIEGVSKALGSSASYRHYEGELKGFVPLDEARRYISVFRLVYSQTLGDDVPFLEQSILGGENTLRGYGRNRFIDNSYFLLNLEERIRLFRWEVFNVKADWELAPFIDFGSVMDSLDRATAKGFEFNPGIGFRGVVRPNIVGRIDVGFGKDGPAVFVGLGYPF